MKYGEQVTTTIDPAGVMTEEVDKIVGGNVAKHFVRQSETVKVSNNSAALAEFLKLMDRQKAGEVHSISFECIPSQYDDRSIHRVKMTWICAQT